MQRERHQHPHDDDGHHGHVQGHGHHDHGDHGHAHGRSGLAHRLRHLLAPHSHDSADRVDTAMETSRAGLRTLWVSFAVLAVTAVAQATVVALSGSVALLGDAVHNVADALTAVPLGIAFLLGRRAATRRYTYGYGRAEDLAGVVIVLTVAASCAFAAYEAVARLLHPRGLDHPGAVALAALAGFAGNEWVARHRIRTGRAIGSAALVADGMHARTDGFTSLAVLLGAGGSALGLRWADPVVGLLITVAIALVARDAAREVGRRLMDCVDPALVDAAEAALRGVPGVLDVGRVRMRWIGHALRAETEIVVDAALTVADAHGIAVAARHALAHAVPRLTAATVHTGHVAQSTAPAASSAPAGSSA
ncbi:cation diffusion facilitator family transporter [Streptomyces sp. PTM05]|uniref:Cation diffusion facilitator family transporter n=1 Tax=Streptantibioticus parmotrematis TaxID=2873249 RepID=A0ABS7QTY2_9ACTN|nr:cation diffusion facilitator family transporter [Streptantibioticus parmotrematis]MBY8886656.1 cation diffusion facilitator family transporter [Streptantibioticus parmotrematis]